MALEKKSLSSGAFPFLWIMPPKMSFQRFQAPVVIQFCKALPGVAAASTRSAASWLELFCSGAGAAARLLAATHNTASVVIRNLVVFILFWFLHIFFSGKDDCLLWKNQYWNSAGYDPGRKIDWLHRVFSKDPQEGAFSTPVRHSTAKTSHPSLRCKDCLPLKVPGDCCIHRSSRI